MNDVQKQITEYIGSRLRGEKTEFKGDITNDDYLSQFARMSALLYVPNAYMLNNKYGNHAATLIARDTRQIHEWKRIADAFENAKADIMQLKGIWIRKFYKQELWRSMNDIDVLYKPEQKKIVDRTMRELGYEIYEQGERHTAWVNYDAKLEVEMHHTLAEGKCANSRYFDSIWDNAVLTDGFRHVYEMTPMESYPYFVRHLKTHVMAGDTSLRRILDIYVLMLNGASAEKFRQNLEDVDAFEFARKTEMLVKQLFDGIPSGNPSVDEYAEMVLGNRNYAKLIADNWLRGSDESAVTYAFKELFPKPDKIYVSYPWVNKNKVLLPVGYVYRLIEAFGSRSGNARSKVRQLKKRNLTSDEQKDLEMAEKLLKEIGC